MLLVVAPSANMVMVTTHQQIVLNAFSYGVLHLVREAVGMYFQRRQLGAERSVGMLAGAARGHRGPPPKDSERGDTGCVKRTRFTVGYVRVRVRVCLCVCAWAGGWVGVLVCLFVCVCVCAYFCV